MADDWTPHIVPRIREWRHRRDISIATLAQAVGRSEPWLLAMERGDASPMLVDLVNLAQALEVPWEFLVTVTMPPRPPLPKRQHGRPKKPPRGERHA